MRLFLIFFLFGFCVSSVAKEASTSPECKIRRKPGSSITESLYIWGKLIDVIDSKNAEERELLFEPKTTFSGPRLKILAVFQIKDCPFKLKPGTHFHVYLNKDGSGKFESNLFGMKKLFPDGKDEAPAKSEKYPDFEPIVSPFCGGYNLQNYKSGDLFTLATPVKIEEDIKFKMRVITFKTEKIWLGPKVDSFKLLQRIGQPCESPMSIGSYYPMILQAADSEYYYMHCCSSLGGTSKSFEPDFLPK